MNAALEVVADTGQEGWLGRRLCADPGSDSAVLWVVKDSDPATRRLRPLVLVARIASHGEGRKLMTIVLLYGDMQRRLKTLVKELSRREPEIHDFVWDLTRALRAKSNDIEYHRKEAFARKHSPVPLSELLGKVSDGRQGVFSRDLCIEQLRRLLEDAELWTRTQSHPEPIFYPEFTVEDGVSCACHILYQNQGFEVKGNYSPDEQRLLFLEHIDLKRRKFERLRNKFDNEAASDVEYRRVAIPESVRIAVWRRDDGKCAKCGSRANLEYDHIVPVSKGGSNTVRNIELLCEPCNRSKSAHIG